MGKDSKVKMTLPQNRKPMSRLFDITGYPILLVVIVLMTFFFNIAAVQSGEKMYLLEPLQESLLQTKEMVQKEVYEKRIGMVNLNTKIFHTTSPESIITGATFQNQIKGNKFQISFFSDKTYDVIIDSEKRLENKTIMLSGKIIDSDLSTFTLTLADNSYIMNLQDLSNAILYRVVGNSLNGIGKVTEIDQKKIPPMIHLPPLIPPTSELEGKK